MGEITDEAAEYATVERLSKMLQSAKEDYKATEAYALFGAIVCWVMQRARTPLEAGGFHDTQAHSVGASLSKGKVRDKPWSVPTARDITSFKFFKEVRDAFAHGDARSIRPINQDKILRGHSFDLKATRDGPVVETVNLVRADMIRLGVNLANVYCHAMKQEPGGEKLEQKASEISEEALP